MDRKKILIIKLLCTIFIVFFLINSFKIFVPITNADGIDDLTTADATVIEILIASSQVIVIGFFTIKFTYTGIQYFTSVAASEKADCKNRLKNTLLLAVITILGMRIFGILVGVLTFAFYFVNPIIAPIIAILITSLLNNVCDRANKLFKK